eukprot:scaffold34890_cov54-Cyclotella_meneghiniana.AAC.2
MIGDLKWLAMLLGMENHSGIWCIKCLLTKALMQLQDHDKGEERTIQSIIDFVNHYSIDDNTPSDPKYKGVMGKPLWDFIPIKNYILPLLHMWMGIFNDVDEWFLDQVDKMTWKDTQETALLECVDALDKKIEQYTAKIKDFTADTEGKRRAALLRRRNQQTKAATAAANGRPVGQRCNPLTEEEEAEFEALDCRWRGWQSMKESFVKKRRDVKKELKDYLSELKKSNNSVYAAIDNHWKDNNKSKGSYHGGKWNGIDSRDGMSDPDKYFGAMRGSLKSWRNESVATEQNVDELVDDVIDLLKRWHEVFHLLRAPRYVASENAKLDGYVKRALEKHRDLGLSVTQKCHLVEDHAREQCEYLKPIPISALIEESVEQNHQIGFKHEEQVKRIKDESKRAYSKAKRICISRNVAVQKKIAEVNEIRKRGTYKTKQKVDVTSSPPVYRNENVAAVVTHQKSEKAKKEARRIHGIARGVKRMIEAAPALSPLKMQRTESVQHVATAAVSTTTEQQQSLSSPEHLIPRQLIPPASGSTPHDSRTVQFVGVPTGVLQHRVEDGKDNSSTSEASRKIQ